MMDPNLQEIVRDMIRHEILVNGRYWLALAVVGLASSVIGSFLGGFFRKSGENKAMLKDLAKLTHTVEEIKSKIEAEQKLRFAAVDKRLDIHQNALRLSRRLTTVLTKREELEKTLSEIHEFFNANEIYLQKEVRAALHDAYFAALEYSSTYEVEPRDTKKLKEQYEIMAAATDVIAAAVDLPPLRLSRGDGE